MELYEFAYDGVRYRHTSGSEDIVVEGRSYTALPITRTEISKDLEKSDSIIEVPYDFIVVRDFKLLNPVSVIEVTIRTMEGITIFFGRIDSCSFLPDKNLAKIKVSSIKALLKAEVPTRTYSSLCSKRLFSSMCKARETDYKLGVPSSTTTITNNVLVNGLFANKPSGFYVGGKFESGEEKVHITKHDGNSITLAYSLIKEPKEYMYILPGCDKLLTTCKNKYNNVINFGGFPFIPSNNPVSEGF